MSAATTGMVVDLSVGDAEVDDPARGEIWGHGRTIRAHVLADLLTGMPATGARRPRAIKLRGARIASSLDLEGTTLTCPLLLQDCYFDEPVNLSDATSLGIRLPGCQLPALSANQLHAIGSLEFNHGAVAYGEVGLIGARIGGQLDLGGASLNNPGGAALSADLLTVEHSMYCRDGFTAHGEVRLNGARIGGELDLTGASLSNPTGVALFADGLNTRRMLCRRGFIARGQLRLPGAHISGQLNLSGATLTDLGGMAFFANRIIVEHSLLLDCGFSAQGKVSLAGASVGGRLSLAEARLANPGGVALDLEAASVGALYLLPVRRPDGAVRLTNARTGDLSDSPRTWPSTLDLRGFVYEGFANDQVSVRDRLRWLTLHHSRYTPQVYDQLANTYRRAGREEAARKVGIAKQWRRRSGLNLAGKLLNWLLYVTVGYGYRTWLAGIWLAGFIALGTWVFGHAYPHHMTSISRPPAAFHPLAYTLDILIPIVNLGQQNAWQPQGSALYWSWALTGVGWILTTAVVAGLTGIFKRD